MCLSFVFVIGAFLVLAYFAPVVCALVVLGIVALLYTAHVVADVQ